MAPPKRRQSKKDPNKAKWLSYMPAPEFIQELEEFTDEFGMKPSWLIQKAVEARMDAFRLIESELNKQQKELVRNDPRLLPSSLPRKPASQPSLEADDPKEPNLF